LETLSDKTSELLNIIKELHFCQRDWSCLARPNSLPIPISIRKWFECNPSNSWDLLQAIKRLRFATS